MYPPLDNTDALNLFYQTWRSDEKCYYGMIPIRNIPDNDESHTANLIEYFINNDLYKKNVIANEQENKIFIKIMRYITLYNDLLHTGKYKFPIFMFPIDLERYYSWIPVNCTKLIDKNNLPKWGYVCNPGGYRVTVFKFFNFGTEIEAIYFSGYGHTPEFTKNLKEIDLKNFLETYDVDIMIAALPFNHIIVPQIEFGYKANLKTINYTRDKGYLLDDNSDYHVYFPAFSSQDSGLGYHRTNNTDSELLINKNLEIYKILESNIAKIKIYSEYPIKFCQAFTTSQKEKANVIFYNNQDPFKEHKSIINAFLNHSKDGYVKCFI